MKNQGKSKEKARKTRLRARKRRLALGGGQLQRGVATHGRLGAVDHGPFALQTTLSTAVLIDGLKDSNDILNGFKGKQSTKPWENDGKP